MEAVEMPQTTPTPSTGDAANPQAAPQTGSPATAQDTKTLPNLLDRSGWPSPTADDAPYTFVLFDLFEYQRVGDVNAVRWDVLGWRGGDTHRLWIKSEGALNFESPLGGDADLQVLYGRLISPFFDLQLGARVEQRYEREGKPTRVFAVVGVQGLAPGRFEVEPALFVSNTGKVSGRFTASLDLYQTQRLIWQPRFETEIAAQRDEEFGVERGLNDAELGVRLRYEIRREFAPYFGVSYRRSFGATRERVLREGGDPSELQVVIGVRMWR
jgi:copper resistance protein B